MIEAFMWNDFIDLIYSRRISTMPSSTALAQTQVVVAKTHVFTCGMKVSANVFLSKMNNLLTAIQLDE